MKNIVIEAPNPSFKSCPREGASNGAWMAYRNYYVSSHAPVRGHQIWTKLEQRFGVVSSHAPVRGHPWL